MLNTITTKNGSILPLDAFLPIRHMIRFAVYVFGNYVKRSLDNLYFTVALTFNTTVSCNLLL